jgi:hypothetical protein
MEPAYDEDAFPEDKRPVIRTLNAFLAAQEDGRIPRFSTGGGPDYETGEAVFYIPEENEAFRRAVATVLPGGTYRIEVQPVYGGISGG